MGSQTQNLHRDPKFTQDGPEHSRLYRCTYVLGDTTHVEGTHVEGEWKTNMGDAKESAAAEAIKVLRLWA